jgi:hypothetical protein
VLVWESPFSLSISRASQPASHLLVGFVALLLCIATLTNTEEIDEWVVEVQHFLFSLQTVRMRVVVFNLMTWRSSNRSQFRLLGKAAVKLESSLCGVIEIHAL